MTAARVGNDVNPVTISILHRIIGKLSTLNILFGMPFLKSLNLPTLFNFLIIIQQLLHGQLKSV